MYTLLDLGILIGSTHYHELKPIGKVKKTITMKNGFSVIWRDLSPAVVALVTLCSTAIPAQAKLPKNTVVATITVGSQPNALVVSPDSKHVYVACGSDAISVIHAPKNKVTSTIAVSSVVAGMAISPDGGTLYCITSNNTLLEISTATEQVTASFTTASEPIGLAVSPDGTLVYVAIGNGTVMVLANNSLLSPINVGGGPEAIVFSPDGSYAYVTNNSFLVDGDYEYGISTIDTATNSVASVLVSSQVPYPWGVGIVISPDGGTVYFSAIDLVERAGKGDINQPVVGVMDTASNSLTTTIYCKKKPGQNVLGGRLAITPDGAYLYIPLELKGNDFIADHFVLMIDTTTDAVIGRPIIVGNEPGAVAVAPDGKNAYVANYGDGTVSVLNIRQN